MRENLKLLFELYITFLKIGSFTIGGGYAMLPIIQTEAVDQKKWCTEEEMINYVSIAQSLPGMFAANVSAILGNKIAGLKGAIASALGIITPSLIIISVFANFYYLITEPGILQDFFDGLRSGVYALIMIASVRFYKTAVKTNVQKIFFVSIIILYFAFKISAFYLLIIGAFSGIFYKKFLEKGAKND